MLTSSFSIALLICALGFVASIFSTNKIRSMKDLTTAVLGRKYGQHFAHHLVDATYSSQESVDNDHSRFPMKRIPFFACCKLTDSKSLIQELQTRAIPYHRIAKSHKDNHYCIKADIHKQDREHFKKISNVEFTVLQPFVPLMKFDLSLLQLHSRYLDPLTSHLAYHPIMQDVAKGEKIGFSLIFTHDTTLEDQQQFIQTLHSTLQSTQITPEPSGRKIALGKDFLPRHLFTRPHHHTQQHKQSEFITAGIDVTSILSGNLQEACDLSTTEPMESRLIHRGMFITLPTELHVLGHESQSLSSQATFAYCMYNIAKIIAQHDKIMKVGLAKPLQTQNNLARLILQSGGNSNAFTEVFTNHGLNGSSGVVLGVSDTGIDENSCFFIDSVHGKVPRSSTDHPTFDLKYRKVIQYVNFSGSSGDYSNGHGTHVAGTLAGYCSNPSNNMNNYHGMSSMAKLAFFDIGVNDKDQSLVVPYHLGTDLFQTAYAAGAHIHSNSWGGGYFYDAYCIAADEYLYETGDFMAFFAVGNNGAQGRETALSPGLAKNVIAVGATQTGHYSNQNIDYIAFFSSMGPTLDGRIKPDILGPGFSITSAMSMSENTPASTCSISTKAGTSMATPAVASTAGLIQDYFQNPQFWQLLCNRRYRLCQRGKFTPNGALIKALVLHSGQNVSYYDGRASNFGFVELGATPDSYQGYGRMRLDKLLPLTTTTSSPQEGLYIDDMQTLTSLTELTYRIVIPNTITEHQELKVTIAWLDPPNDYFASQLLINDIDLLIEDPHGRILYGNAPLYAYGTHRDEYNPHEQITIPAHLVTAGNYTIRIQAKYFDTEQYSQQSFAIVITTNGIITEPKYPMKASDMSSLDINMLQKCAANYYQGGNNPILQVGIALWARVTSRGWSNSDYYTISSLNTSTLQVSSVVLSEQTMTEKFALQLDDICLHEGIYSITMNLSASAVFGSQLSLPDCQEDLLLTPLMPTGNVVILSSNNMNSSLYRTLLTQQKTSDLNTTSTLLLPDSSMVAAGSGNGGEGVCIPMLTAFTDHYKLSLNLTEYAGGSGWSGTYYTLFKLPYTGIEAEHVIMSGTMDWGTEQVKHVTIPLSHTGSSTQDEEECYALQLSFPSKLSEEEYPEIYFHPDCPYIINMTVTMTQFCISASGHSTTTTIRFYTQPGLSSDLGQLPGGIEMFQEYANVIDNHNAVLIGSCQVEIERAKGMIVSNGVFDTTADDSNDETNTDDYNNSTSNFYYDDYYYSITHPTNTTPSYNLTYHNHNLSCLHACVNYPGHDSLYHDLTTACLFLASLFKSCDSYALSAGLCIPPDNCMQSCDVAVICYLGAGNANSCPVSGNVARWRGDSNQSQALSQQCLTSYAASVAAGTDASANNNNQASSSMNGLIIAVVVIMIMIVVGLLCVNYYKSQQQSTEQDMVISSSTGSPIRSNGPTTRTASVTNTASKIVERGKNIFQKKFRHSGNETVQQQQYEMVPVDGEVRNPFTIRNDDDEDEDEDEADAVQGHDEEMGGSGGNGVEDVSTHSNRAFELGDEDDGDLRL